MKAKKEHKRKKRPGLPPGTLEFTGEQQMDRVLVHEIRFSPEVFTDRPLATGAELSVLPGQVTWYDVRGLHDVSMIDRIGQYFNMHPLVLEDIVHTSQRPKFEEYGQDVFIVLTSLSYDDKNQTVQAEQISIYFGENFLLTFQEKEDDTFLAVRERLHASRGRIRSRQSDYLAYALIDSIVDNYFEVLDCFEAEMEGIEDEINTRPVRTTKERIHRLKFEMLALRKSVMPLREAVGKFSRCESKAIDDSTGLFVRDLYDHVIRISDLVETYRDMLNGLQELYLSELSLRMNNVIQVLTIITTIFVPLTFLAGIYGMNFDNMPELHWQHGYFYLLGAMAAITVALLFYFKKKNWV